MGCGHSKASLEKTQPAAPTPNISGLKPAPEAKLVDTNTTSTEDTNTSSRETTPNQKSTPTSRDDVGSKRRSTSRFLEGRNNNDRRRSMSDVPLAGPPRDYSGLQLEITENERLSHITSLASTILKAACAFVVLGIGDRMVMASAVGVEPEDDAWLPAFCSWALSQESGGVTIEDMQKDSRTSKFTWVTGEPNASFYSGASVHNTQGERLGVLCVLDFEERPGATVLCTALSNLAEMVQRELATEHSKGADASLLYRAMDTYWDGSVLVDTKVGRWCIKYANQAFSNMTGINRALVRDKDLWDFVDVAGSACKTKPWERYAEKISTQQQFEVYPVVSIASDAFVLQHSRQSSGSERQHRFKITMRPNSETIMKNYGVTPEENNIKGVYFAVFTPLLTNSRGSYSQSLTLEEELVPFEGVEMGPIIGKGSFGSVFRAAWGGRIVALKVIEYGDISKVDAEGDPLEASLMTKMKHPNIVETIQYTVQQRVKEASATEQQQAASPGSGASSRNTNSQPAVMEAWLMLEFCDLGTLSDGIETGSFHEQMKAGEIGNVRVPLMTVILETARDIAMGLQHIHSHSILHGDLTAGNVLLASVKSDTRTFVAKIADFGLSRQAITSKVETNTYGTVTHMPPELLNEGHLSKAADVYAYGVLLYEMFTRKRVWEGLRHPQIIHAIAVQKKHPELPDTAPQTYKDLADMCMAAEPEDRPGFSRIIELLDGMLKVKL